jgi:hypothetical protein
MLIFLDTEFTSLLQPELLSLGLVTADRSREHYVELDLETEIGQARRDASNDFVRYGVLDLFGLVPDARATVQDMGHRTGEWLLALAAESGAPVEVGFDYSTDYELMEDVIRESGLWDRVRDVVRPVNVANLTGTIDGELAAEECYREFRRRGLGRHHALADAHALAFAYRTVNDSTLRLSRLVHSPDYTKLVVAATGGAALKGRADFDCEGWLRQWLLRGAPWLGGRRPLDVIDEPGSADRLEGILVALAHGAYQ